MTAVLNLRPQVGGHHVFQFLLVAAHPQIVLRQLELLKPLGVCVLDGNWQVEHFEICDDPVAHEHGVSKATTNVSLHVFNFWRILQPLLVDAVDFLAAVVNGHARVDKRVEQNAAFLINY